MVLILILIKTEAATPFLIADLELDLLKVQGAVNHFGLIRDAGAGIVHHLLQHLRYGPLKVWADSLGLLSHGLTSSKPSWPSFEPCEQRTEKRQ